MYNHDDDPVTVDATIYCIDCGSLVYKVPTPEGDVDYLCPKCDKPKVNK